MKISVRELVKLILLDSTVNGITTGVVLAMANIDTRSKEFFLLVILSIFLRSVLDLLVCAEVFGGEDDESID